MYIITDELTGKISYRGEANESSDYLSINDIKISKNVCAFSVIDEADNEDKEFYYNDSFHNISKDEYNRSYIEIMEELDELDVEVPRLLEDLVEELAFVPHASKQAIIDRKIELRAQLAAL